MQVNLAINRPLKKYWQGNLGETFIYFLLPSRTVEGTDGLSSGIKIDWLIEGVGVRL